MASDSQATATVPSLIDSLRDYLDDIPEDERADALHQVFFGFYTRVALIDRLTYELAKWANEDAATLEGLPGPLAEALRDNAMFVGQELFARRVRAMSAMAYVSTRLQEQLDGAEPPTPFTLTRVVAFDSTVGRMRTYDLSCPGEHPHLPYDPVAYDASSA